MIWNMLLSTYCTSSITSFLTAAPDIWFPIILVASSVIIAIAALIYILGPLLGRNDIKVWARAKVYDAFITIIFALLFISLTTTICTVDPTSTFRSIGLLPTSCDPQVTASVPSSSDIYGLSLCDLYQFNQFAASFTQSMYWVALIGGLGPTIGINLPPVDPYPINPSTGSGVGVSFSVQLIPIIVVHQYIIPLMQAFFVIVLASQLLQILLSSSMLLLSIFLILGLLARSFSITKSFGGAMIAFGLGLGFVYPFMVACTYGFMDTAILNVAHVGSGSGNYSPLATLGDYIVKGMIPAIWPVISGALAHGASGAVPNFLSSMMPYFGALVLYGGLVNVGLELVPLLNLVIVDAFIVDFSKAIGERMDLFSILTRII